MAGRINYPNDNQSSNGQSVSLIVPEEVHQVLANILKSKHFANAPKKQKFLHLICSYYLNGQASELNEYLIGRDVFDRDDHYNPAADPIVRVGAHDIRKKLDLYYQNEGAADPVRLVVPVGSYEPVFIRNLPASAPVLEPTVPAPEQEVEDVAAQVPDIVAEPVLLPRQANKFWMWGTGLAIGILALSVVALLLINQQLKQQLAQPVELPRDSQMALSPVWEPFLKDTSPSLLILSNPVVYRSANEGDPGISVKNGIPLAVEQARALNSVAGNRIPLMADQTMRLIPAINMYTGIGEAIGTYRLSGLLQALGEKTLLKQSRNIGPEDLKQYDAILLGSVYSNQWSKPLSLKENFIYSTRATIQNLAPQPGEQAEYKAVFDQNTGDLIEDYALISVTPGVSGDHTVMVLAGLYSEGTQAAAEFVTTTNTLHELELRLTEKGSNNKPPRYYQALLKAHVENAFPTKAALIAFRELKLSN